MNLYKNIKTRRTELGITQTELAEMLGYSDKSMIAKIEAGKVDLTQSRIVAFAEALKMSPGELFGWNEEPYSPDMTSKENQLLENFRKLDENDRKMINTMIKALKASSEFEKKI